MTNSTGGTVRRLTAGAIGATGLFVVGIGLGSSGWSVAAAGAALVVGAVGLAASTALRGRQRAWRAASAHVISASPRPVGREYGRAELELVLTGPGLPATAMTIRDPLVPADRWPTAGTALPVLVAVDDRRRVRIQWSDAPLAAPAAPASVGAAAAEPAAAARGGTDAPAAPARTPDTPPVAAPTPTRMAYNGSAGDTAVQDLPSPPEDPQDRASSHPAAARADPPPNDPAPAHADPPSSDRAPAHADPAATVPRPRTGAAPPARGAADVATSYPPGSPGGAGPLHAVGATLPVADLSRAVDFYRRLLDFTVVDQAPGVAVLAAGDTRLVLRHTAGGDAAGARPVRLNLEVGDITAAQKALEAAGVTFGEGPVLLGAGDRLEVWSAAFADPDGHSLAVTEWRAASPEDRAPHPQQIPPHQAEDDPQHPQRPVQ